MRSKWYESVNPKLDRLANLLSGSKPSHGYTIAEKAPEIVTAPGVYFPAERGSVIPLSSRNTGGDVIPMNQNEKGVYEPPPLHKDNERAKLEMLQSIISKINPGGLEHHAIRGLATPPEPMKIEQTKYDILKSALSVLKPQKVGSGSREKSEPVRMSSRQGGGNVSPTLSEEEWNKKTYGLQGGFGKRLSAMRPLSPNTGTVTPTPTPKPDLYDRLKASFGSWGMTPTPADSTAASVRQKQGPGFWQADIGETPTTPTATSPLDQTQTPSSNPIDRVKEYLRQLTTMFSRADGGEVVPPEDEINRLRGAMRIWPPTPESIELAQREKWAVPGAPERMLAAARETSPGTVAVIPGFEKSYYEAHPEERVADEIAATNKGAIDAITKTIEDTKNRAQGFGLIGLSSKNAGLARKEATTQLPILMANLEKMKATESTAREKLFKDINAPAKTPKIPTPQLVQTENGPVWAIPGVTGVLPLGVKPPQKPEPAVEDQRRWVEIDARIRRDLPITEGEKAWHDSHAEYRQLGPRAYGEERRQIAELPKATSTPGITYSPKEGYQEVLLDGTKRNLSTEEVKQKALEYKEDIPTADLKTMQQSAPSVLELIKQARLDMATTEKDLGPAMSRWRSLMSGKIGAADEPFRKLYTDIGLLQTRLMRMHVGARGGVLLLEHFKTLFDAAKDDPKNLKAAFDSIEAYAKEVMKPLKEQKVGVETSKEQFQKGKVMKLGNGKEIIVED